MEATKNTKSTKIQNNQLSLFKITKKQINFQLWHSEKRPEITNAEIADVKNFLASNEFQKPTQCQGVVLDCKFIFTSIEVLENYEKSIQHNTTQKAK